MGRGVGGDEVIDFIFIVDLKVLRRFDLGMIYDMF